MMMSVVLIWIWNFLLIVFAFGFLIGIHELGHFIAAKWAGIRTNAFAIGMGPVFCSYRKGVGFSYGSSKRKVIAKYGKDASEMSDEELQSHNLSETEYSLRYLPIGGFVSMLGQEDAKPDVVSEDPRSYNRCPIGKRMIVVSAGVVMNVLLAAVLFLVCFQIGVRFEAPIIGHLVPDSPAANALSLGEDPTHLQPSDTIVSIDSKPVSTFTDVQIAGAMAKPGHSLLFQIERQNSDELLTYSIQPGRVTQDGMLELGIYPASSLTLHTGKIGAQIESILAVQPELNQLHQGMLMTTANGQRVSTWSAFDQILQESNGSPIVTEWMHGSEVVRLLIPAKRMLEIIPLQEIPESFPQHYEEGILGLVPLTKISSLIESSPNKSILENGDVILAIAELKSPRWGQLRNHLSTLPDGEIQLKVLRNGIAVDLIGHIKAGKLGILLEHALDIPTIAQPFFAVSQQDELVQLDGKPSVTPTSVDGLQFIGGYEILSINSEPVNNWTDIRAAVTASDGQLNLTLINPETNKKFWVTIPVTATQRNEIASLGWTTPLLQQMFEPLFVIRSSNGNPLTAMRMGIDETVNMVMMTYLTIDRLFRRTVGVEQLRGPIGIVDIGFKIADRGMSFLLFFLAIISVNLAVLNFLPLPIVDGGLFLYLIYEKLLGKPPSIAFQNAAAVLGLGLIGLLFIVITYHDIMRIVG